jgi:hypothetical protein
LLKLLSFENLEIGSKLENLIKLQWVIENRKTNIKEIERDRERDRERQKEREKYRKREKHR